MTKALTYIEIDIPSFVAESPEAIQTWRFAMPADYLPAEIDAIPSIDSVSFTPARISLGKDLGERASLRISLRDHLHIMASEPYNQGTFFGKWRGRYGTKLRGRELRLIRGEVGQAVADMDTYFYTIDSTDGPDFNGVYTIEAKDVLKLADDDRSQAPALSGGSLAGSVDDAATEIVLTPNGIGDAEYPASGWVCLGGKEVVSFTRSGDTLTITRAQFGTGAQGHSAGDRVQIVLRYTGDNVADIINDLLVDYAGIPSEYIPLTEWQEEADNFLNVIYARTITEPTSVRELVSQLIEEAALALYWDDRAKRIRLRVLREISTDAAIFDDSRILEGSFRVKDQPKRRISQIWSYYGRRDPTDSAANEDNFRTAIADVDLEREALYGSKEIRKIQARWVETEAAATRLNSIQISRFRDPPRSFAFEVFRDVAITPAGGYQLRWWGNQDETGVEQPALIQVTHVRVEADRVYVEAEEMLASGVIVLVNVVFLLPTDGQPGQWPLPEDWNDDDNFVACIAPGGAGGAAGGENGGKGGGGGAFSRSTNLALNASPLPMIDYRVGRGGILSVIDGEDTWFDGTTFGTATVAAEAGQNGSGRTGGGLGGQASNGAGDLRTSGGDGGNGGAAGGNRAGGGGGGGAGGPNGDGGDGGPVGSNERGGGGGGGADGGEDVTQAAQGSTGVDGGNNRFGFGGGTSQMPSGIEGGGGKGGSSGQVAGLGANGEQLWTQTIAPIQSAGPGAGGGGGLALGSGGDGGKYGGGAGGIGGDGPKFGDGGSGVIVIGWRKAAEGSPA